MVPNEMIFEIASESLDECCYGRPPCADRARLMVLRFSPTFDRFAERTVEAVLLAEGV